MSYLLIDKESRSKADLTSVGQYRYARHGSTEIMCIGWKVIGEKGDANLLTYPDIYLNENTKDFKYALKHCEKVVAHNVPFEYVMWNHCLVQTTGLGRDLPHLPSDKFVCTLATSNILALPRALDKVGAVLGLKMQKNVVAKKLLMSMCKPRKAINDIKAWREWIEDDASLNGLYEYCKDDVRSEEELFLNLMSNTPWTKNEYEIWVLDQVINQRGFEVDIPLVKRITELIAQEEKELSHDLKRLTFGWVGKASQNKNLQEYLKSQGLDLPNLQAKTVDDTIKELERAKHVSNEDVLSVLRIKKALSKSSTSKYQAFLDRADDDRRVRDNLMYHGASTGRWCLTGDTEFYDGEKWIRFDEVKTPSHNVQCFDPLDNTYKIYKCPLNVFGSGGVGYQGKTKCLPYVFTKDHTWLTTEGPSKISASENIKTVLTAVKGLNFNNKKLLNLLETRLAVMIQADGHYTKNKAKGLYLRFRFKRPRKIERCRDYLKLSGIPFKERLHKDGVTLFVLRFSDLPQYLKDFNSKKFDMFNYDIDTFFEEIVFWDGHRASKGCIEYSTIDKDNADFVQYFSICHGKASRITLKKHDTWNTLYRVFISDKNTASAHKGTLKKITINEKVYCPTTPTGFFIVRRNGAASITGNSGMGVQPQNFPRGTIKITPDVLEDIRSCDIQTLRMLYARPMDVFSSALRNMIVASKGKEFFCADFSSIEARVLLWVAEDAAGLKEYELGLDTYISMAETVYGIPYKEIETEYKAEGYSERRQLGKKIILACGYQMGVKKFKESCEAEGLLLPDSMYERAHKAFRQKYPKIPQVWFNLERTAIMAVVNKGKKFSINKTTWFVKGDFLFCRLPSGRKLAYYKPEVRKESTSWGTDRFVLYYWTTDSKTKQWVNRASYGGLLTENVVQAISRDCMAIAMKRVEDSGYEVLLTVHDEVLCERAKGVGTLKEFKDLMSARPDWGLDIPLKVGGWVDERYRK